MPKTLIFKIFLIFVNLFPFLSFADLPVHVSLEPHFGFSSGMIGEYLYDNTEKNRMLSKLEWDRNLFFYGIESNVSVWRFHLSSDFSASIPKNFGYMRDSDWMSDSNPSMKTTYSVGENNAVQNYEGKISLSFDFFPFNSPEENLFVVSPFGQFLYMYDSFERTKAEGWYGQWNHSSDGKNHWWYESEAEHLPNTYWSDEKGRYVTRKLAGISYERSIYTFFIGTQISLKVSERIRLLLGMAVSPYFYSVAKDTHNGNNPRHYKQIQEDYWNTKKISLGGVFVLTNRLEANLGTEMFFIDISKGSYSLENIKDLSYKTGTSQFSMSAKLGLRVKVL
ncbi:MAG: omptin family outer membrane protease [Treponema sp.]|nr:omptin family outer membrane protease [Treponema sp.]